MVRLVNGVDFSYVWDLLGNLKFLLDAERTGFDWAFHSSLLLCEITEIEFLVEDGEDTGLDSEGDLCAFGDVFLEGTGDLDGVFSAGGLLAFAEKEWERGRWGGKGVEN